MSLRRLLRTGLAMIAAVLALGVLTAPLARADSDDDSITRYDVRANLQSDGSMRVDLDFDFNFGDDSGHGPYLTLPERMRIKGDPDHWRSVPIHDITASSSDAPADLDIERDSGAVEIKIGNENQKVSGTHTYRVSYEMDGVVNPKAAGSGLDELSWNPIGTEWEIPLDDVTVRVSTPVSIERVACFTGSSYQTACSTEPTSSGHSATFRPGKELKPGKGMQVVAGMPAGSFPGVHPILIERYGPGRMLGLKPGSLLASGLVLVAGLAAAIGLTRRVGANLRFAGIAPGQFPANGAAGPVERDSGGHPVAVRFQPPNGVTPGQVGVLMDGTADQRDVTATVIDLATRGHLRVEETYKADGGELLPASQARPESAGKPDGWRLVALNNPADQLRPFELSLLQALFKEGSTVDLDSGAIIAASSACQRALYREATDHFGWFRRKPNAVRGVRIAIGIGLLLVGLAAFFALGFTVGMGFVGVALGIVGVVMMIMAVRTPGRSAAGTAVHDQAVGFREYLATAEAEQIRFEEGIDVFSRYLPYAMIWGLADRWTRIFADLAARGARLPVPGWYVGSANPYIANGAFASAMTDFGSTASSAMTSASSSSGGGSGFSGGGGVGGGGGGGW